MNPKQIYCEAVGTRQHGLTCAVFDETGCWHSGGRIGLLGEELISPPTNSKLSSILRTFFSVFSGTIILPVVIDLIEFRCLINYYADQVRIVERL